MKKRSHRGLSDSEANKLSGATDRVETPRGQSAVQNRRTRLGSAVQREATRVYNTQNNIGRQGEGSVTESPDRNELIRGDHYPHGDD